MISLVAGGCGGTAEQTPSPVWTTATNDGGDTVVIRLVGDRSTAGLAVPAHSTVRLTAPAAIGVVTKLAAFDSSCEVTFVYNFAGDPHPFGDGGVLVGLTTGVGGPKGTPTGDAQATEECAKAAVPSD